MVVSPCKKYRDYIISITILIQQCCLQHSLLVSYSLFSLPYIVTLHSYNIPSGLLGLLVSYSLLSLPYIVTLHSYNIPSGLLGLLVSYSLLSLPYIVTLHSYNIPSGMYLKSIALILCAPTPRCTQFFIPYFRVTLFSLFQLVCVLLL